MAGKENTRFQSSLQYPGRVGKVAEKFFERYRYRGDALQKRENKFS